MDLNLKDACVKYYDSFVESELAKKIFEDLKNIFDKEETKKVEYDGEMYKLNRKTLVFVDKDLTDYIIPAIWGNTVTIIKFTDDLIKLKNSIEIELGYKFNICLANYYINGKKSIGYHCDNEEKGDIECIASISLGAEREFSFRTKDKENEKSIKLGNGSLLVMDKGCQYNYDHSLLVDKNIKDSRLNLTFRSFKFDTYKIV